MNPESQNFLSQPHLNTARLLIKVAPVVFESQTFALKGGAAINLFLRELPRLSIDLDLVFTDYQVSRKEALELIRDELNQAKEHLTAIQPGSTKEEAKLENLRRLAKTNSQKLQKFVKALSENLALL